MVKSTLIFIGEMNALQIGRVKIQARPRLKERDAIKNFVRLAMTVILAVGLAPTVGVSSASADVITCSHTVTNGFNQCGYNYKARVFSGLADGVDRMLDGKVWGDSTYANDHLVMKWNAAWDSCNANGYDNSAFCLGAWTTNEWNGMGAHGSSTTDHVKIIWVGSAGEASPYWVTGGSSIWDNYEVIMDQGMAGGQHFVWAFATPNGLK